MTTEAIDQTKVKEFAGRLLNVYTGSALTQLIELGTRTGLFESAAEGGTSEDIAQRAGLNERYVREWLGSMTTSGIVTYDAPSKTYSLPAEHALLLRKDSPRTLAPMSTLLDTLVRHLPRLAECFRDGGGVPESAFWPDFSIALDDIYRPIYDAQLVDGMLGLDPRIIDSLDRGIRVADVGCGTGYVVNLLAKRFPRSEFIGFDSSAESVATAIEECRAFGSRNVHFEVLNVAELPVEPGFDLITAFDVIHDLADPHGTLRRIAAALRPSGVFFLYELKFSSHVEKNMGNPFAALYYGISVLHCMTVSLAEGGAGLGIVWGIEKAKEALTGAGFQDISVHDAPRPQNCVYVCRIQKQIGFLEVSKMFPPKTQGGCGRDRPRDRPPAQTPARGTTAQGSCLGYERQSAHADRDAGCEQLATTALRFASSAPS